MRDQHQLPGKRIEQHYIISATAGNTTAQYHRRLQVAQGSRTRKTLYNAPSVRRERGGRVKRRQWLIVELRLANGPGFLVGIGTRVELVAHGNLNAAIRRQQRDLRSAIAVKDKRTQRKCAGGNRQ